MMVDHRDLVRYDSQPLFPLSGVPDSSSLLVSSDPRVAALQQQIIQIARGHMDIARELFHVIENLTVMEAQTVVNTLTQLYAINQSITSEAVLAGYEQYLTTALTRLIGHVRGITDATIVHLARQLARSLEPPPEQPGLMKRLFG